MNQPRPYTVFVQAAPEEILIAESPSDLIFDQLQNWPSVKEVIVALPDIENADRACDMVREWGLTAIVGNRYNVAKRLLSVPSADPYLVRVLAFWKHVDMPFVDALVSEMQRNPCDLVAVPKDFDATMAADVASIKALTQVSNLTGNDAMESRARFNPWGYIELHANEFDVRYLEPAPKYSQEKVDAILAESRSHPENEFYGRDYAGSRYHVFVPKLPAGLRILDVACGSGFGTKLLSEKAELTVGVDYLDNYIDEAKNRFAENERLRFFTGDAQNLRLPYGDEYFDLVVSLHTLEHVPDDRQMLASLYRNLKPGGMLIAEVPLLAKRPLGVPINPYHLREYDLQPFKALVEAAGFEIQETYGASRGFFCAEEDARDAVQVWAVKPNNQSA